MNNQLHTPRWLRCIVWLVIASQLLLPYSNVLFAAASDALLPPPQRQPAAPQPDRPPPVTTRQLVAVNRTVPQVQPPSAYATFSDNPSDEEIFRARVFAEPLVPMGRTFAPENRALAQALLAFLRRVDNDDDSPLTQFLDQFPNSAWRGSLLMDLGIVYRRTGHFSKALAAWEEAWKLGKAETEPNPRAIADRAVAELSELNARLGRYERLDPLFAELGAREFRGPATEKIEGARRGLWLMRNRPEKCFRCGPLALDRIRASQNPAAAHDPRIIESRSTTNGLSLAQVAALANDLSMDYQMARREPGAKVITPAVVNWKVGHFAALVKEDNGSFLVQDPTFTDDIRVSQAALDEEASGYFLVPSGPLPEGWRTVDGAEGAKIWGKGQTDTSDPNRTRPDDEKIPEDQDNGGCSGGDEPMARHAFHTMLVSLNIVDTPVRYSPPRGPAVRFKVTYNQRDAGQPSIFPYSNLGNKWTFDWLAYITDDPNNGANNAYYYLAGGGTEVYSGFNSGTSSYTIQADSHSLLKRTSSTSYERDLPDGSKQIFNLPDGAASFPRKIFLTQKVDPAGNTLTYTYDSSFRIVAATDALGQVTALAYTLAADPLKVTKVTDPFGRFATFDYAQNGGLWQLVKITDVIGIASEFTYSGDFITSLKTPYGTTSFAEGDSSTPGSGGYTNNVRWLEATDPLGQTEHLEYHDAAPGVPSSETSLPTGLNLFNSYLNYRDSFYWDKKAWHDYPGDFTKAHVYHFTHTTDGNSTSGALESDKAPLEIRVWRNYPGQAYPYFEGTNGSPSKIARLLDDGSTQLYQFQYNPYGKPAVSIDPTNRTTVFTYAANFVDLLQVGQLVGGSTQVLARFTYNSQHLPLTAVDAAGQTSSFGYNSHGQLLAATNALNETVMPAYSTNGYLTNIVWGVLVAGKGNSFTNQPLRTNSFAYDGTNRVRTVTDSEGYTLTFDYDSLDRPTKITYPDNTFEQIVYYALDPVLRKDRRGHWTATAYDPLRRVTDVQDSLNRITHLEWCGCGALASITDPAGNVTTWLRDLQGRVTSKIYADSTQLTFGYETNTSRLRSVTDAKNQTAIYDYFVDNGLRQVTYSNAVISTPTVAFAYDTNYNRLTTMTDGTGTNIYSYYPVTSGQLGAGRLKSIDGPLSNDTVTNFYDALGRITNRVIAGVAQTVAFDSLHRATIITNALGRFTNVYVGATDRISTNFYPNGQKTIFNYFGNTSDQRLQTIWNQKSNGTNLSRFDYTHDADGQIATWAAQADTNTPTVQVIEYDPVDQLLSSTMRSNSVTGAILKQFVYGYDKAANRTSELVGTGSTPSLISAAYNNLNQLTNTTGGGQMRFKGHLDEIGTVKVAGSPAPVDSRTTNFVGYAQVVLGTNVVPIIATDYSGNARTNNYQVVVTNALGSLLPKYDANGNMTNDGAGLSYEYDAANRTTAINRGTTNRTEMTYDGLGRRVKIVEKQNGAAVSTNTYLWCGVELCEQRSNAGGTLVKRFFSEGEQISGTNYFFTRDHLGSVREMTDATGAIRARYDYEPYGVRTKLSGNVDADLGYTGHFMLASQPDHTFTLYRLYRPDLGRWLNRDPIQERGGINPYNYVRNNPLTLIDPIGLWTFSVGFTISLQWGWVNFTASAGVVGDTEGNFSGYGYGGGGSGLGAGFSAGVSCQASNAKNNNDLSGPFGYGSLGGGFGGYGSLDGFWGNSADGPVVGGGATIGVGLGGGAAAGVTGTAIHPIW